MYSIAERDENRNIQSLISQSFGKQESKDMTTNRPPLEGGTSLRASTCGTDMVAVVCDMSNVMVRSRVAPQRYVYIYCITVYIHIIIYKELYRYIRIAKTSVNSTFHCLFQVFYFRSTNPIITKENLLFAQDTVWIISTTDKHMKPAPNAPTPPPILPLALWQGPPAVSWSANAAAVIRRDEEWFSHGFLFLGIRNAPIMDQSQLIPPFFTGIQSSKIVTVYLPHPPQKKTNGWVFRKPFILRNCVFVEVFDCFYPFQKQPRGSNFNGLSLTPIPLSTKCEATKCTNQDYSFQNQDKDDIVMWWTKWAHQFCPRKLFICLKKKTSGFTKHLQTEKIWILTCLLTSKKNEPNCKQLHY